MTKLLAFLFLALVSFNQNSFAQVDDSQARAILNKISEKAKSYENMKFEFSYRMIDKAHNIDNSIKGSIVMQGDKYNLHIMGRNVISDGKTMWTFDPDAEEIQINNADEAKDAFNFLKLMVSIGDDYKAKLIKTIKENGVEYYLIDLTPIEAKSYYKVRLKVNKLESWVEEANIYEKDNVEYNFKVDKFSANLKLPANFFALNPAKYPDAEVVDLR